VAAGSPHSVKDHFLIPGVLLTKQQ
jgi:hypothetical protein